MFNPNRRGGHSCPNGFNPEHYEAIRRAVDSIVMPPTVDVRFHVCDGKQFLLGKRGETKGINCLPQILRLLKEGKPDDIRPFVETMVALVAGS